jgi:hypothetical protein
MSCNGSGYLDCYCAGDHCAHVTPPACPGCEECGRGIPEPVLIARLCELYDARISVAGDPAKLDGSCVATDAIPKLRHLRWMLSVIPALADDNKANRWLGFIQGVLFDMKVFSIDELRNHVTEARR